MMITFCKSGQIVSKNLFTLDEELVDNKNVDQLLFSSIEFEEGLTLKELINSFKNNSFLFKYNKKLKKLINIKESKKDIFKDKKDINYISFTKLYFSSIINQASLILSGPQWDFLIERTDSENPYHILTRTVLASETILNLELRIETRAIEFANQFSIFIIERPNLINLIETASYDFGLL